MLNSPLRFPTHLVAAVAALLLFAAPSLAAPMAYSELLTSNQSVFGGNVQVTLETSDVDTDLFDILLNGNTTAGSGIGDGLVTGLNDYVMFTHTFSPTAGVASVNSAELLVILHDDFGQDGRREGERATIELNDDFWASGSASFVRLYGGDVTALFQNNGDELTVAVISSGGDFIVDSSYMNWIFETDDVSPGGGGTPTGGGGASPVPEPTGLALFCVGAVVIRRATRQQA